MAPSSSRQTGGHTQDVAAERTAHGPETRCRATAYSHGSTHRSDLGEESCGTSGNGFDARYL